MQQGRSVAKSNPDHHDDGDDDDDDDERETSSDDEHEKMRGDGHSAGVILLMMMLLVMTRMMMIATLFMWAQKQASLTVFHLLDFYFDLVKTSQFIFAHLISLIFGFQLISKDDTVAQPDDDYEKETNDDGDQSDDDGDDGDDEPNEQRLENALTSRPLPASTSSLHPQLLKKNLINHNSF